MCPQPAATEGLSTMTNLIPRNEEVKPFSYDEREIVSIFRRCFGGATHVYAIRNSSSWQPVFAPLRDSDILSHINGKFEIGTYPVLSQRDHSGWSLCTWIGADFDGKKPGTNWKSDVIRLVRALDDDAAIVVNVSRSGQGAHVRALFAEPVPAWLCRRWMLSWVEECGLTREDVDEEVPSSFDRVVPSQDELPSTKIGSLFGCPLNKYQSRTHQDAGLLIDVQSLREGEVLVLPLEECWKELEKTAAVSWSRERLESAVLESPSKLGTSAPQRRAGTSKLPVIYNSQSLSFTTNFCHFMRWCAENPEKVNYDLWVALASNLHSFGEDGRAAFHEISALDQSRYSFQATESKWQQTSDMGPVRCSTIAEKGYRCPHLGSPRCGGSLSPAQLHYWAHYEAI